MAEHDDEEAAAQKEEVSLQQQLTDTDMELILPFQRLKSALWYSIGQFVDNQCQLKDHNATPQFIGALTELVWTQIGKAKLLESTRNSTIQKEKTKPFISPPS